MVMWALAFTTWMPMGAAASTIVVPTDQPTIQAAVSAATTGDTVLVQPGTYAETIRIGAGRDGLTIAAADEKDPPIVLGVEGARGADITIAAADDVTIRNVVVRGGNEGVRVDHAYGATLSGVRIENAGVGVYLLRGGRHHIVASEIVATQVAQGIRLQHSPEVTIKDVVIDDTAREGILVRHSRHASIADTTVSHAHAAHGIMIVASSRATLTNCTSRRNDGDGIQVKRSPNLVLRRNDAEDNGSVGLRIDRCIPFASVGDVIAAGNQASANRFRDIVVTRPNCRRNRCVTTTTRPPNATTSTTSTTTPFVTTSTPTTTNPTPTTQPTVLPRWRLFVRIARQEGAAAIDVDVPSRSSDPPLVISLPGLDLSAFRTGDQVTASEIAALGGDTLARFENAATAYIAGHPSDYPGFDGLLALDWVMRVPAS
jgi:parallel beta-helix repeat protein